MWAEACWPARLAKALPGLVRDCISLRKTSTVSDFDMHAHIYAHLPIPLKKKVEKQ